ncbi:unnamed protein product [Brugia timori]|uniref:Ovule protein n=1 Tax=Brugia timori TaxID=42155 RepID=A0A0R3QDC0_9BILA|nr:unnamed protein product [Brugia timori]
MLLYVLSNRNCFQCNNRYETLTSQQGTHASLYLPFSLFIMKFSTETNLTVRVQLNSCVMELIFSFFFFVSPK